MIACLSILRRMVRAFTRLAWRPRRQVRVVRLLPHGGARLRPAAPPRPWRDAP
ncbi:MULTISPECIES: hypothetical protein [unclassified Inquilinus]|jgi:hypothetical protein|uniref:hypothetical protein n=1 Tax=unclassified Inquilinus TaxID=2645927 RepID=UPI003F8E1027